MPRICLAGVRPEPAGRLPDCRSAKASPLAAEDGWHLCRLLPQRVAQQMFEGEAASPRIGGARLAPRGGGWRGGCPAQGARAILQPADLAFDTVKAGAKDRRIGRRPAICKPDERAAQVAKRQDHVLHKKSLEGQRPIIPHPVTPSEPRWPDWQMKR